MTSKRARQLAPGRRAHARRTARRLRATTQRKDSTMTPDDPTPEPDDDEIPKLRPWETRPLPGWPDEFDDD